MKIKINRKICPGGLKNNPNKKLTNISFITIHCTGNYSCSANAKNHADYLYSGSSGSQISWHYTVDKDEIWQSFEDTSACWHAANYNGNMTSIGIEITVNDKNGFLKACNNAAWLVAELLKKYNLDICKVVQHNYWSGKNCPAELRSGAWGINWSEFINLVKKYLSESNKCNNQNQKIIESINILAQKGIIKNPEYWVNNYRKLEYLDLLIINMAKFIK